jgi:putative oxygen-independent coproporphyrinogen III oxidase
MNNSLAIYFHWPFCLAKCPYCDFNVHVTQNIDQAVWRDGYLKAIDYYAKILPGRKIVSVFFGGGTPSLMEPGTIKSIIEEIKNRWTVSDDIEITLEANPTSVETKKFEGFYDSGINRVSLGVQSLNDDDLKFLGRKHDAAQAIAAIETARAIFPRFSFDLIYARPNQSLESWRDELRRAIDLSGGHMSLYQLTIERSTPFYFDAAQGKFNMPDDAIAADFYDVTQDIMEGAGLPAYEVSNHARLGHESRHNLVYWRYGDYAGIGPGAHGRLTLEGNKFATREHQSPDIWIKKMNEDGYAHHPFNAISPRDRFMESMMMGFRLREGVEIEKLESEGECDVWDIIDRAKFDVAAEHGWIALRDRCIVLSRAGMLRLNALIPFLVK